VISYDDISSGDGGSATQLGPQLPSAQPPTKKRKTHNKGSAQRTHSSSHHVPHWDDPDGATQDMNYDDAGDEVTGATPLGDGPILLEEEEGEEEESRDLTHQEIWDDSALIDAWNSAAAEYEQYHGKNKNWKKEPVKKSPLWHVTPPSGSKSKSSGQGTKSTTSAMTNKDSATTVRNGKDGEEDDSKPFNFDTYVPNHDPSLSANSGPDYAQYYLPNVSGATVSQDEAFERALSAMYWGGYWTAVYHYQRQQAGFTVDGDGEGDDQDCNEEDGDDAEGEFLSTQR